MFKDGNLQISTLEENNELYQQKYLETFGLVDLDPSSALGTDLSITSEMKKKADEFTQFAYMQNSPFDAIAEGLKDLCFLRGIKKKYDENSICFVVFSGDDGTVISKGSIIENSQTKERFFTNEKGIITAGTFGVFVTAENSGRVVCNRNTLTKCDINGVTVTNSNDGIVGFDEESDTQLRSRLLNYENTLNMDEKVHQKLLNLHNVKGVNVVSNPELETDINGIPARSTAVVILGGENKDIAKLLFSLFPADKKTSGSIIEYIVSDVTGKEYIVRFTRPEVLELTVVIKLTVSNKFNPENLGVIKESVLSYSNKKYSLSDNVIVDNLYIPVQEDYNDNDFSFIGIENIEVLINGVSQNIEVAYNQYATISSDNLTVEIKA